MTSNISLRLESDSARPDPGRQHGPSAAPASDSGHPLIDGPTLKTMIAAGYAWLERHKEIVNALNVFPVPDGDTGTNMLLTMQSAWHEIEHSPDENVSHIAQSIAHGALMGARGNSGVILSQIWRGFARGLSGKKVLGAADLPSAMRAASETAYKGVLKPVEGTILTVSRAVADGAEHGFKENDDLLHVLDRMVSHAREAVANTPNQLEILKQAGVVDSGGQGLTVILEGMLRYLRGESVEAVRQRAMWAIKALCRFNDKTEVEVSPTEHQLVLRVRPL